MGKFKNLVWFGLFLGQLAFALTVSNSGQEVRYEYEASFRSLSRADFLTPDALREESEFHSIHLFGIFHSPEVAEEHGFSAELIEGFAGTKFPVVSSPKYFKVAGDPYLWISYRAAGTFILENHVARDWLGDGATATVKLPLLSDLPAIYRDDKQDYRKAKWKKCTDEHYWEPENFSYFYLPYQCRDLGQAPIAKPTEFHLSRIYSFEETSQAMFPRKQIDGDNGNGKLTTFYFVAGFDGVPESGATPKEIHRDDGWKTFASIEKLLTKKYGFKKMESLADLRAALGTDFGKLALTSPVHLVHDTQHRYFSTFVRLDGPRKYVARSALFDTENEVTGKPLRSFPKFWKEAWENGDVIYFGGHSGDGKSLNLDNILRTLELADIDGIHFSPRKTQVALLDSCSSYAHYQELYYGKKPQGLHLVTTGLVSLFHLAESTIDGLIYLALGQNPDPMRWMEALADIEAKQLPAHIKTFYAVPDREEARRYFEKRAEAPSSLMSVRVPDSAPKGGTSSQFRRPRTLFPRWFGR